MFNDDKQLKAKCRAKHKLISNFSKIWRKDSKRKQKFAVALEKKILIPCAESEI